jgi:hypothetical protein
MECQPCMPDLGQGMVEYWNVDPKRNCSFISFLVKKNFANKSLIIPIFQLRGEAELSSK